MPEQLKVDARASSHPLDTPVMFMLAAGVLGLGYLLTQGRPLHFESTALNVAAHVALVALPLLGGMWISHSPLRKSSEVERLIMTQSHLSLLRHGWWIMLPLAAPLITGLLLLAWILTQTAISGDWSAWSTHSGIALTTWIGLVPVGMLYTSLVCESEEVRISDEGIRWGMTQFAEWNSISQVSLNGDELVIYHRVQPSLPFGSILRYPTVREHVEPHLKLHDVRHDDATPPLVSVAKSLSIALTVAIVATAMGLYLKARLAPIWTLGLSIAAAFSVAMAIEYWRGILRATRGKYRTNLFQPLESSAPPSAEGLKWEMRRETLRAVQEARMRYNLDLDVAVPEHVEAVEGILASIHQQNQSTAPGVDEVWAAARRWGAFVGEAALRVVPGQWQFSAEGAVPEVHFTDGTICYPIDWCYKRLTDGEADNVWMKFQVTVLMRDQLQGWSTEDPETPADAEQKA